MTKISSFNNVSDTKPKKFDLDEWLKMTMNPSNENVLKVLKYRKTKDKKDKENIPCITVSASFKKYRNLDHIKKKHPLICIDVDRFSKSKKKRSNNCIDMNRVKEMFAEHPCTLYAGFSTGGDGIYAIIRLAYNDRLDEYFEHFKNKLSKIGINIDESCKDYTRLRFFSYDPEAYYNPGAKYYKIKEIKQEKPKNTPSKANKSDTDKVEALVQRIEKEQMDITSDYDEWVKIGGALYSAFGENGRDYFHRISKFHSEYNFKNCDNKFTNCKKLKKVNISSLFYIASNYGVRYQL